MKRYYRPSVDLQPLPTERSGKASIWETKKVIKIIDKRKKKAAKNKKHTPKGIYPSPEQMAEFKAMSYPKYLKTKYWKKIKAIIRKKYKFTCQGCGSHSSLEVHHKRDKAIHPLPGSQTPRFRGI